MSATSCRVSWFGTALVTGSLFCSVPLAAAKADLITYSLSEPPDLAFGSPGLSFPAPYGTVTVDRSDDFNAHITFTAGSSNGIQYYFVGQGLSDNFAAAVNVNAPFIPDLFSFVTGNAVVTSAPDFFAPLGVSSLGSGHDFFGAGFGGIMNAVVELDLGPFQFEAEKFALQSIAFDVRNLTSQPWASANQVLTPDTKGFLASAGIIGCAVANPCNKDGGILVATSVANGPAIEPVPEPASLALLGTGLLALRRLSPRTAGVPGRGSRDR